METLEISLYMFAYLILLYVGVFNNSIRLRKLDNS